MQGASGLLIIVIGIGLIYLGITGRYNCFESFFKCIRGADCGCGNGSKTSSSQNPINPLEALKPLIP